MKFLLTILSLLQFSYGLNVKNVSDLKAYTGTATEIVVMDFREYGPFFRYTGFRKTDGGVIVADGLGRLWQRMYRLSEGVEAGWWGAKGDGVQNALPYLKLAGNYCMGTRETLKMPESVYRITSGWHIGTMSISATDSKLYEAYDQRAPSYNLQGLKDQNSVKPFSIIGNPGTILWGDFESTRTEPVMFYGLWGVNLDHKAVPAEIKNLIICGKKSLDAEFKLIKVAVEDQKNVGLLMQRVDGSVTLSGMQYHGLETGQLINGGYWTKLLGPTYSFCKVGLYTHGSHSTTGWGMVGLDCGLAFHINSGASVFNQMNTERCGQSLLIGDGFNVFNGLYFERYGMPSDDSTKFQIQVGYDEGHPVRGTIINGLTLAATYGIILKPTAFGVTITGSQIVSAGTKTTGANNALQIWNSYQDIPKNIPGKLFVDGKQLNAQ